MKQNIKTIPFPIQSLCFNDCLNLGKVLMISDISLILFVLVNIIIRYQKLKTYMRQ